MDNKTFESASLLKSYDQYITKYSQKEILDKSSILQHRTGSELPEECTFKLLLVDQFYHSNPSITAFLNSIQFNGSYKTCLVINDDEPLSRKIEFNLFDHVIYLNKDIDQLYFQLHQFFVACQKESFSRYKLFLTSDVFLQFHADRRTLVDTNSSQYSPFIGKDDQVSFTQEIELKLSACHYVHTAEINFNKCKINCHLYKIDEVILAVICEREKHKSVKSSASCHNGSKSNIALNEASDTIKPLASESQTSYPSKTEKFSHHERRRSSLAKLQLKMVQKSPVVDLLQRIKDQQITLNDCLHDGETKDNLFSLFEDISDVLGKLVQLPPLAKHHISDKTIGDAQSTDLAYGLLNKPSQRGKNPLKSSTRASTIHSKRNSTPTQPEVPVTELVSANLNENYVLPSSDTVALPPEGIEEIKNNSLAWEFDVFKIENLSNYTPLEHVGMELFRQFNAFKLLKIDEKTGLNWLQIIQSNYRSSNTYHNSTHAADVMQATAHFLTSTRCQNLLAPLDMVACLVAAAVHDVDHRGKTNQFLCNSMDPLAIFYNDKAVLENHHVAMGFQLTLAVDEKFNILKNLDDGEFKSFRSIVIEMVLATEMSVHFDIVNKFINLAR